MVHCLFVPLCARHCCLLVTYRLSQFCCTCTAALLRAIAALSSLSTVKGDDCPSTAVRFMHTSYVGFATLAACVHWSLLHTIWWPHAALSDVHFDEVERLALLACPRDVLRWQDGKTGLIKLSMLDGSSLLARLALSRGRECIRLGRRIAF